MDKKILDKIKKCLRLAQSSEPHEAAAAMRQAQKLMELHGVTSADVDLSSVAAVGTRAHRAGIGKMPQYVHDLAAMVAQVFGCEVIFHGRDARRTDVRYIGMDGSPELAAYAYEVLKRQLEKDRRQFVRGLRRSIKPANRTKRGDLFCEGWIMAVRSKVQKLVVTEKEAALVKQWMQREFKGGLKDGEARKNKYESREYGAFNDGLEKGRAAQLHAGVATPEKPKMIS